MGRSPEGAGHASGLGDGVATDRRPPPARSTQRIYDANLRLHVFPELGEVELGKLTPSVLRAWLAGLMVTKSKRGSPLSPASVGQAYRTLNRVLSAAVADEILGRNPLAGIRPPRASTEEMRFLAHDEVATLVHEIDDLLPGHGARRRVLRVARW